MKLLSFKNIVFLLFFFSFSVTSQAQCAMCRAVLQTEESGVQAAAINDGIVYLMAFPYLLLVVVGWAVYKVVTKKKKLE